MPRISSHDQPEALVLSGGWPGHDPASFAERYRAVLEAEGCRVVVAESLSVLDDPAAVALFDLIVPAWTMGELSEGREQAIVEAVRRGSGLAGQHGGMADAFRTSTDYQLVVGGQFVWHPRPQRYDVRIVDHEHPVTRGIADFTVFSEPYYMHVDPSNRVLATTHVRPDGGTSSVEMPVAWTRSFGRGRVFYFSVGHFLTDLDVPEVDELMRRGMRWSMRAPNRGAAG